MKVVTLGGSTRRTAARSSRRLLALLEGDEDPLGVDDLTTHQLPLAEAPSAYEKEDGAIKVVLKP